MASGLLAACAVIAACSADAPPTQVAAQRPAPPEVAFVTVKSHPFTLSATLPGRTSAFRVAQVRPQVSGIIRRRLFEEGADVEAGQALYQIDPAPYEAAVDSAAATLARAEAAAVAADNREERFRQLLQTEGVSQQEYDDAEAAALQARAEVALARAALKSARIDLERTRITAPIAGRIGRTLVTGGALVNASQAQALAVITALDPIYVDVAQSSAELLRLKRKLASGELQMLEGDQLEVKLTLEDGGDYTHTGRLALTEVSVQPQTGSVTLRAVFPNPQGLLLPGMFVRAEVVEGVREDAILVPQRAVTRDPLGNGVAYVVDADNRIDERAVEVERASGDQWLIAAGLQAGERLVVEGFQRIRPGVTVTPVPFEAGSDSRPAAGGTRSAGH